MKATEFVKKFGIDKAKDLACRDKTSIGYLSIEHHNLNQEELKQIVDAFELVDQWGGLEDAKLYDLSHCKSKPDSMGYKLIKAINLVEQCQ